MANQMGRRNYNNLLIIISACVLENFLTYATDEPIIDTYSTCLRPGALLLIYYKCKCCSSSGIVVKDI